MELKKKYKINAVIILMVFVFSITQSCTVVQPYEMQKINDSEMQLSAMPSEKFETNFQVYREGASGANGGKSGGGCGCN